MLYKLEKVRMLTASGLVRSFFLWPLLPVDTFNTEARLSEHDCATQRMAFAFCQGLSETKLILSAAVLL